MNNEVQLTPDEKLALGIAMKKQLDKVVDENKADAKLRMLELSEQYGADSIHVKVGETRVGKISISGGESVVAIVPGAEDIAIPFLREYGLTEEKPIAGWEKKFEIINGRPILSETGENGEEVGFYVTSKAQTVRITGCKPADVMKAAEEKFGEVPLKGLLNG